jgi:hypothetical protein
MGNFYRQRANTQPRDRRGQGIFLSPEGVSAWHERKGHKLKRSMVRLALALKPEVLIIGNGVEGALKIGKKARKEIEALE